MSNVVSGPDTHPTTEIPKSEIVEGLVRQLTSAVNEMRDDVRTTRADVSSLVENGRIVNERLGRLELWRENVDGRLTRTSERVQNVSDHDMEQAAKLAAAITKNTELETAIRETRAIAEAAAAETSKQTQLLNRLLSFADKPMVQRVAKSVGYVIIGIIATYAAQHGISLAR